MLGDLSVGGTITNPGLQTILDNKQDVIIASTDLTCNSITAKNLSVDTRTLFDTIVIRRPSGITGVASNLFIALRELQVWIDGVNLLPNSSNALTSYFANWAVDKDIDIGSYDSSGSFKLYNEDIIALYSAHSIENSTANIALIIKNIPLTIIETIQSIVLYNRASPDNKTTIGLAIELYNSKNDSTLLTPLASTNEITTAVNVYRFDFADIASYSTFATGESTSNIIREEDATTEVVSVAESPTEMLGGLSVVGQILNPNKISFRAYRSGENYNVSTEGETLPFDGVFENIGGHYSTTTYRFTAPISGIYLFYVSFSLQANQRGNVDFVRVSNEIETLEFQILRGYTIGSVSTAEASDTMSFTISVFAEVGDQFFPKLNAFSFNIGDNKRSNFGGYFIG